MKQLKDVNKIYGNSAVCLEVINSLLLKTVKTTLISSHQIYKS